MEHPIEEQIWRLLPALEKLKSDNDQTTILATTAADNLRRLIHTGVFGSLTGKQRELMRVLESDQTIKDSDRAVAKVLLSAFDAVKGNAKLSHREIGVRCQLTTGIVRASLNRLVAAGYFLAITPSERERDEEGHALKYVPQFEAHLSGSAASPSVVS